LAERPSLATLIMILVFLPFVPYVVKTLALFFGLFAETVLDTIPTTGISFMDIPILTGKYLLYYLFYSLSKEQVLYVLLALGVIYVAAESRKH
jgi:hypothetical protein